MGPSGEATRLPHRVVIVGGGFAGLYAARSLGIDPEVRLTLVDRRNFHLFQPLLYQVATGALSPGDIAQPLRSVLRKQRNTTVILGEAVGLDPERARGPAWPTAARSRTTRSSSRRAPTTRTSTIRNGRRSRPASRRSRTRLEIRRRILIAFEAAEREADPERRRAWMTFVLVGGGPTGVELAGALGEIAHDTLKRDFRSIRSDQTRVILLEAMDRILPPYPPDRSASAQRQLEQLGVEVRTRTRVTNVDEDGVRFTGPDGTEESIAARTVFWAAGVLTAQFARTVAEATGAATDRSGRVIVEPDLTIPGHPEIFVVGDAAVEPWKPGKPTPGVAQGAMQGGSYAAKVIRRRVLGRPYEPFRYSDHGDVAVIGRLRGHQHQLARAVRAAGRVPGLGAVARHPHLLPDRVLEPDRRPRPLGVDVPDPRSRRRG